MAKKQYPPRLSGKVKKGGSLPMMSRRAQILADAIASARKTTPKEAGA